MNMSWAHFFLPARPAWAAILCLKKAANEISPPEARPCRCSLLPETVAGGTGRGGSPPFTLAVVALQPATLSAPLAPGGRGLGSTPAVYSLFLLSWQQEYKDSPWLLSSWEAAIFALKVTDLGAARTTTSLVERAPKEQMARLPKAKRKLSCHLRPWNF